LKICSREKGRRNNERLGQNASELLFDDLFLKLLTEIVLKAVANTGIESELWIPESEVRFSGG
jgi:hypothetical protein